MCSQAVCVYVLACCPHVHVCSYWCAACDSVHSVIHALVCCPCPLRVHVGVQSVYLWGCGCVDVQPVFAGCGVSPSVRVLAHTRTVPPGVAAARRGVPAPWCGRAVVLSPRGPCRGWRLSHLVSPCWGWEVVLPGTPPLPARLGTPNFPGGRAAAGRGGGSVWDAHRGEPEPLQLRALRGNQTPRVSGTLISGPRATCRFGEPCFLLERGDEGGPRTSFLSGWQSQGTGLGWQELQGSQSRGENSMGTALGTSDADRALDTPDCNVSLLRGLQLHMSMQRRGGR